MKLAILFCTVFCLLGSARSETFEYSSLESSFSLMAKLTGQYTRGAEDVVVKVDHGKIVRSRYGSSPRRKVLGIKVFLAEWTADKRTFQPLASSEYLVLKRTIETGEAISIESHEFRIPIKGMPESKVNAAWIAFEIVDEQPGQKSKRGTCYVHAPTSFSGEKTVDVPRGK